MRVWTSHYHLFPKNSVNSQSVAREARLGTLLKIEFDEGLVGYGDCCPFVTLGDESLQEQLDLLVEGRPSPLMKRTLHYARLDAEARSSNQALLKNLSKIKNHLLITDLCQLNLHEFEEKYSQGYNRLKVKMGRDLFVETEMLKEVIDVMGPEDKIRIDFNLNLTEKKFKQWFDRHVDLLKDRIEFIEDPFFYDETLWAQFQNQYEVSLALDRAADPLEVSCAGANVVILKPATQDVHSIVNILKDKGKQFSITHYMDYPIGQMFAVYEADQLLSLNNVDFLQCGLQAREIYEDSDFSRAIGAEGPYIVPPTGYGVGFDDLIEDIEWTVLK